MTTFADLPLDPLILQALQEMGYEKPSQIQEQAIPIVQAGHDLIALAKTGSGKTAACAIPVCDRIIHGKSGIQALIIVPTRELALQYVTETQKIGKRKGVKAFAIFGGEDASLQSSKLRHGVDILVATPGRLIDFIYSRSIDLTHVEMLVLDEADEMLSLGFYDDLVFIIDCLTHKHQTILFSATMPPEIRKLALKHMKDPMEVEGSSKKETPDQITHNFIFCRSDQKNHTLTHMIAEYHPKQSIIFCKSRYQCEDVCHYLKKKIPATDYLHGGLTQEMRNRITGKFRTGKLRFLVATDVAARGLDFSQVTHVILYNLPEDPDTYVHRSGRTGRFDKHGIALTLVSKQELPYFRRLQKHMKAPLHWLGTPPSL